MSRISWTYRHSLNRQSKISITKYGDYLGKVRHTARYSGRQLAIVKFDKNKLSSRVPFGDLVFEANR